MSWTPNVTESISQCDSPSHESDFFTKVVTVPIYILGLLGNFGALVIILRSRGHNTKHRLLLGCLVSNDLVALITMLAKELIRFHCPALMVSIWMCRYRVIRRTFVFYSGSVVVLMSIERYLALTKPFYYKKTVSVRFLGRSLVLLWICCLTVLCAPLFGFGAYYNPERQKCKLYTLGTEPKDVAYAYLIFFIVFSLISCNVWCNWAVIKDLYYKKCSARGHCGSGQIPAIGVTRYEIEFSKLMVVLSIFFIVCWLPQMISILLSQFYPEQDYSKIFARITHILITSHFLFDPFLYVLQRWPPFRSLLRTCFQSKTRLGSEEGEGASDESEVLMVPPVANTILAVSTEMTKIGL